MTTSDGAAARTIRLIVCVLVLLAALAAPAGAQYFGRNKVQYRGFEFHVLRTDHFDLYCYPEEAEAAEIVARMAERWHARLSRFFGHQLRGRQPVILYAASAHFRQTNAIEGLIGEGTGGVTEAIKRRIVLPMSGSLADTDHVLGHELVHAFQFDLTGADPRENAGGSMPGILAFPLWFVEGMAEYLSLGPVDAQTAMWLRDAALRERLPHVADLDDWRYFPYRWGHAFWAYIGATHGDRAVASLIRSAANPRFDLEGFMRQLGTDPDTFTAGWHAAIQQATSAVMADLSSVTSRPRLVVSAATGGGRFNVGPRVSPDGRAVAFFSERDRFSVELFLADVESGRIERKLLKTATDPHFDSLEFLNSAGAWSPDGRTLVVTAIRGGRPVVVFIDPARGRITREVKLAGLDDALNPSFAPDGRSLVLSGNAGGLVDLYRVWLDTARVQRLTEDAYADLEPVVSPDGASVIFVSERFSTDLSTLESGPLRLARLDLATGAVRPVPAFLRGKHLSPQLSADGRTVTFIADPDGIANLYRMPVEGGPIERLSSLPTGVAGITTVSPALSASATTGRLLFSVFENDGHAIYALDRAETVALVAPPATPVAAVLPGTSAARAEGPASPATVGGDVQRLLADPVRGLPAAGAVNALEPYRQGLTLDAIGQPSVGLGVSEFGGSVSGAVSAFFSDMLGDRALGVAGEVSGKLADFGGQLVYLNRRHRWNWAAALEVSPYRIGYLSRRDDPATGQTTVTETIERQPSRGAFGVTSYPFNSSTRVEFAGGMHALSFTRQVRTGTYITATRELIDIEEVTSAIAPTLYLAQARAALVHDTSFFGATSPLYGARYRLEIGRTAGSLHYVTALADWRRYYMPAEPFTIAVRALHYGRYGQDAENDQLVDLYAGHPEFVRGYGVGSFSAADCLRGAGSSECGVFRSLLGSRVLVTNLELRAPLVGLFSGTLEYGRLPLDVALFADAGVAWSDIDRPEFAGGARRIVRSVGGAIRANAFNLFALEISVARPLDRANRSLQWQLGIRQGF
jgi:Tol biopolymer transport system component